MVVGGVREVQTIQICVQKSLVKFDFLAGPHCDRSCQKARPKGDAKNGKEIFKKSVK